MEEYLKNRNFKDVDEILGADIPWVPQDAESLLEAVNNMVTRKYAEQALKLLEKDVEFEIVQVLSFERMPLGHPECGIQDWYHLIFTAKPKNADCINVSPKHYLAELLRDDCIATWKAKHCSTFEPSDDPRFQHGCMICPADLKIHPSASGYTAGREPYYKAERVFGINPASLEQV